MGQQKLRRSEMKINFSINQQEQLKKNEDQERKQ